MAFLYLIFNPNAASFSSYGGVTNKYNYGGASYRDISNTIYSPNNVLLGLTKITTSLSLNLNADVDNDFVLGINSEGPNVDLTYSHIVFGPPVKSICSQCSDKIVSNNECVAECP